MDALSIVTDEVALEGLDGITLPTLWIRLENREPRFPLQLDESTKGFIWRALAGNADLRFFQLPSEREDVVLIHRFKDIDPETGINTTLDLRDTVKDIYPICAVTENKDGIQGSCALFKQRTDVTKHVRSKSLALLLTLEEARDRYGRKLVVVASQTTRFRTLIGSESDPDLKLSDESYCVLEKVARARWQGELQRDLHGSTFKVDARKFHYLRKSLVRHQLITMQSYGKLLPSGQQQHSILLLLKRFHVNRRTKYDILMEFVSNLLQQSPNQFTTVMLIKNQINVDEGTFRRLLKYMRAARLVEFFQYPLEELDPSAGPCTNKNGSKVTVRCCKLVKQYVRKGVPDYDDDDDDDEETDRNRGLPSHGRIMEKDLLSQAYDIVLSCGTKGISQREIGFELNVGKLEARMVCRKLESEGLIQGFMEDEGRQRTTKFISHRCVGVSDRIKQVAKEREKNKLLKSSTPETATQQENGQAPSASKKKRVRIRNKKKKAGGGGGGGGGEEVGADSQGDEGSEGKDREAGGGETEEQGGVVTKDAEPDAPAEQPPAPECEAASCSESVTPEPLISSAPNPAEAAVEQPSSAAQALPQPEGSGKAKRRSNNQGNVVCQLQAPSHMERSHETYRLLRRKNLILEAVNDLKIIEGLFPLQKIINEQEKQDGLSSKCCKKTIKRLVQNLSRQGLLKIYTTTVIQDGITRKVDMIVHPSVQATDSIVNQLIEQVRLKISSSYAAVRQQHIEERTRELEKELEETNADKDLTSKAARRRTFFTDDDFKPTPVRGLSRTLGFQPKMHRLRAMHTFLWYLIYGHQQQQESPDKQDATDTENAPSTETQTPKDSAVGAAEQDGADGSVSNLDEMYEDEDELKEESTDSKSNLKVYVNEDSWRRFIPPLRQHKDFSLGWAIVGDLLLCLPLSVYVQIIQVNYKVDGLEEYLSDPVKQHYLIRALPVAMKRQLLYKRRYIFVFYENLQKLAYMGLLQFGPVEKFKEKEQTIVYLKRHTTIVDTTNAEPHYWLVTESPDKPFERRRYALNTSEDVENFWFDLMCVCLNTPLGVIRSQRRSTEHDVAPAFVQVRHVFEGLAHLLKGSLEVCDDGTIPGDGKGAAGLDSEFFGHLKRNWLWTNHLLSVKGSPTGSEAQDTKTRLKSLVSRNSLRIALKGGFTKPRYVTTKRPVVPETVELRIEPASRNQQVLGGRRQKRKRSKKDPAKAPRKRKKACAEPKKRTPAHDEADHKALKMMTRQRVYWSVKEDSLMMVCCVASHLLNSQLQRPFVPHCVVRDLLQSEFEVSLDKTSVAVYRRCRYILKNPQTLLNYRICLAEVYQDKAMMKKLVGSKPADPETPEDCATAFSEYVRLLRQKFSPITSVSDFVMPSSKQELFARFKVSAIDGGENIPRRDALNCTADIHTIVLFNLIQSTLAMSNSQMKSARSFQTFHMYSKYDQELLCQVFIQCRKKGLVNRRRVNQPFGPKKNRALPILPMSYQLSHFYYRCFSWRFPLSLCTDSFCFMRTLIDNGTGDTRPIITFYHETESRSGTGEDATERNASSRRKEKQRAARDVEQTDGDSTKDKDKDQAEGEERLTEEAANSEKSEDTSRSPKKKGQEGDLVSGSCEGSSTAAHRASDTSPDVSDMLQVSLETVGGACVVSLSLMSLGLLSVYMSIPKRVVVVDTNLVDSEVVKSMTVLDEDDDDEDDGDECEGKKKMQVKAHQASHTKYLMMRGYCLPGIVKQRNLNTCDNIVVESCRMRLQLRDTPAHRVFREDNLPPLDFTKCGPSLLPSILASNFPPSPASAVDKWEGRGYTREDVEAVTRLRASLDQAGQNGLDAQDLHQAHGDLRVAQAGRSRSLQQYLKDLEEEGRALRVGSLAPRWVLQQHADAWLLTVNNKQWSQTRVTPDRLNYMTKQHHVPFMRRRCVRQRADAAEEPPAKRANVEGEAEVGITDAERESGKTSEANEGEHPEQQMARTDQKGGEKPLNQEEEEGEKQLQPEEGGEKEETSQEEKKEREDSNDEEKDGEPCSPPSGSADNDNISFVSRPWRLVDGKLNRHACKGMLEAVLFHIMSRPGITQQALVAHYQDLLQPMAALDLVQALMDLGCVTRKTMVRGPKPSLFSRPAPLTGSAADAAIEDPEAVYYEPTLSCCLRLCQVLPNERQWNSVNTQ